MKIFAIAFICSVVVRESIAAPNDQPRRASRQIDEFKCDSGDNINSLLLCDGSKDCQDGSDETKKVCSKLLCPTYSFRCNYGACIDKPLTCDGKPDCADSSDELLPECRTNYSVIPAISKCNKTEFRCDSGQCVDGLTVCDGQADCADGSDESINKCIKFKCPKYSFQCAYGACIDKDLLCNGKKNCHDGSDEDDDICSALPPPPPPDSSTTSTTVAPVTPVNGRPSSGIGHCVLPRYPDGASYFIEGCEGGSWSSKCKPPGSFAPLLTVLNFTCHDGYTFLIPKDINSIKVYCLPESGSSSASWIPSENVVCYKTCKPLVSSSLDINCFHLGRQINCSQPVPHNTVAELSCKDRYYSPHGVVPETKCIDGSWDQALFSCIPECGTSFHNAAEPAVSHGQKTTSVEYPWHAGIYTFNATSHLDIICGGTIISPLIILTAAHCLFDEVNRKRDTSEFRVAVGKTTRAWNVKDDGQDIFNVDEMIIPDKYNGRVTGYDHDIALLRLSKVILLTKIVLPVCMEYVQPFSIIPSGTLGTVVGWGFTENETLSDILQIAQLPFIERKTCLKQAPDVFRQFITYDKFCAGYSNGTGVQRGDSGGGLTFVKPTTGLHFLRGIVSVKPVVQNTFAAFTDVNIHVDFILKAKTAIERSHKNQMVPQ